MTDRDSQNIKLDVMISFPKSDPKLQLKIYQFSPNISNSQPRPETDNSCLVPPCDLELNYTTVVNPATFISRPNLKNLNNQLSHKA